MNLESFGFAFEETFSATQEGIEPTSTTFATSTINAIDTDWSADKARSLSLSLLPAEKAWILRLRNHARL